MGPTKLPCSLVGKTTDPSDRCTKFARSQSVGPGWSLCRACWLKQQGTQTPRQAWLSGVKQRQSKARKLKELPVDSAADKNSGELVECETLPEFVEASDYQSAATIEGIVLPIEEAADLQPAFTHNFVPQKSVHQSPT